MSKPARHYINGEWLGDGSLGESINPANDAVLGHYHKGSAGLTEQAARVARATFFGSTWAHSPRVRAQALFEFADQLGLPLVITLAGGYAADALRTALLHSIVFEEAIR